MTNSGFDISKIVRKVSLNIFPATDFIKKEKHFKEIQTKSVMERSSANYIEQ